MHMFCARYPKSISYVIMDVVEKAYLAGFPLLLLFVSVFPLAGRQSAVNTSTSAETCLSTNGFSCPDPQTDLKQSSPSLAALEFLPLMVTSIYCAIGLVWGFLRLGFVYLQEETRYQGQLSEIK